MVTHARPGESWHNFGRAFDVVFRKPNGGITWDGPWSKLGALGKSLGLTWGGDWPGAKKDQPHFEYHPKMTLAQARAEFEKG